MDILAITETSENNDTGFLTNIEIEGYERIEELNEYLPSMKFNDNSVSVL